MKKKLAPFRPVASSRASDRFRQLALAQAGASEGAHMGHADFRVRGKIFATLGYPDDDHGMVKLTPEQQRDLITQAPEAFAPCAGAWGRHGATAVRLSAAKAGLLRAVLKTAWNNLAG